MKFPFRTRTSSLAGALLLLVAPLAAEVSRVEIVRREEVLRGQPFGDAGPYEKLVGRIHFSWDPDNELNAAIVDLDRAPRNREGRVEAQADLLVLRPLDPDKGSGTALLEVSNRGSKASLGYFNGGSRTSDPTRLEHFGDGFLMRRGLTLIWVGWQFDVPDDPGLLRLRVPKLPASVRGLVRSDWTVEARTQVLDLAHRNHRAYPVVDPADEVHELTVRDGRLGARRVVPREAWSFEGARIRSAQGFEAGKLYELVYRSEAPAVVGLGLAAIRDTLSHARHAESAEFPVERGIAVGISQTGRFLRHFLYQGFNTDEAGRQVFDGLLIHTAGAGRGSFNHRFAQPSRDGHRYSAFFYPTDLFPFSGTTQRDPVTKQSDGLFRVLRERGHVPKIFSTNTGYEYWGRAGALLHVSVDGQRDVDPLPEERIYHLASAQHFVDRFPPAPGARLGGARAWVGNPLDLLVTERALLAALLDWVERDRKPPASKYPRISNEELAPLADWSFPELPGIRAPAVAHEAYRVDYGERFTQGIIDHQPPLLGQTFPTLVPAVDAFGNELGGIPAVETLAPLATYTPWSLRLGLAGEELELRDFRGMFIPLPRTQAERKATGDPRPSIQELYASKDDFLAQTEAAAVELMDQRFLLEQDLPRVLTRAEELWDFVHAQR